MAQRITAIAAVIAASACIVACVFLWRTIDQTKRQHVELLTALASSRAPQSLTADPSSISADSPSAWLPLVIKLATDDGKPVRARVVTQGEAIAGGKIRETVHTNPGGIADFGPLPPGEYSATCMLDDPKIHTSRSFLLGPGRPNRIDISCPSGPPGLFDLVIDIRPPEWLKDVPLYYLVHLDYREYKHAESAWSAPSDKLDPVLLVDSIGQLVGQTTYDKTTTSESRGIASYINYIDTLPTDFPLNPPTALPAYSSSIQFWPLVKDPESNDPVDGGRPALKRLTGAALRSLPSLEPVPGRPLTVKVEADQKEFWNNVTADLKRIKQYEGLAITK